jgi:hypothetical protein
MSADKRANSFHIGQVWESRRGKPYKVTGASGSLRELRRGKDGDGQLTRKEKYDVEGWVLVHDPFYPEQSKAIT